jgi:hypothetical protein
MKTTLSLTLALAIAVLANPTWAAQDDAHLAHHPADSVAAPAAKATPNKAPRKMACVGMQMQAMHAMHDKMMAAKTPEERNALMAEQMTVMQNSMDMMKGMSAGGMGGMKGDKAGYEPKMEMMQGMMQMMMDRLPAAGDTTEK